MLARHPERDIRHRRGPRQRARADGLDVNLPLALPLGGWKVDFRCVGVAEGYGAEFSAATLPEVTGKVRYPGLQPDNFLNQRAPTPL